MKIGNFITTGIGSLPFTDPAEAVDFVLRSVDIPFWPQLPKRGFMENMYIQFSEGIPGVMIDEKNGTLSIDTSMADAAETEALFNAYMEGRSERFALSPDHVASLQEFLGRRELSSFSCIKGQITGPLSFGLQVCDMERRPVLYDDVAFDIALKALALKAEWQAEKLSSMNDNAILFVDEPFLSALGSAYVPLEDAQVVRSLDEIFSHVPCMKAIHCCGNTNWSLISKTKADIISFDAYNYGKSFALYAQDIKAFLERGGIVAWGIVPASKDALNENADSLVARLNSILHELASKGISMDALRMQSMLTPSCGTGSLEMETSNKVFELLGQVSRSMR